MKGYLPSFALAVLGLAVAAPARAQDHADPRGSDAIPSEAVTPPKLTTRADAVYPREALRLRLSANVGLEVTIDENGAVSSARVIEPAGHGFDESALEAVKKFVFAPARSDGRPVRSTLRLSYEFHAPEPEPEPAPAPPARAAAAPTTPPPPAPAIQQGPDQSTLVLAERPTVPIGAPPERNAASVSSTSQDELALRPRFRAEGLLEVVPGLFSVEHAGGGKAHQYFARGFNIDHGTDMAFFVDDVPINAVSHAHGQGFSDLHFIIPETVARVDSTKGPYAADVGDFGTAGSTSFRMADHTPELLVNLDVEEVEAGPPDGCAICTALGDAGEDAAEDGGAPDAAADATLIDASTVDAGSIDAGADVDATPTTDAALDSAEDG